MYKTNFWTNGQLLPDPVSILVCPIISTRLAHISVEWKQKNVELWKVTVTKSCLMVGTQKPMKNFKKISVFHPQ